MTKFDFSIARTKHLAWKSRLRGFLDGRESLTEAQAVSHRDCDLGLWLYGEGLKKYGAVADMKTLEKEHVKLHVSVKRIVELKHAGNNAGAEEELKEMNRISGELMDLLSAVERKIS